jgi:[NiFe] hydrogenase large subunit/hydrogenase large subunit
MPDLVTVAKVYKEWANYGGGHGHFLAVGDWPDASGNLYFPRGVVMSKNLTKAPAPLDLAGITEYVAHSWYRYTNGATSLHPSVGQTVANFTGPNPPFDFLDTNNKYSWLKAPRYAGYPMEVGPLARVVVAYAAGHARVKPLVNQYLAKLNLTTAALFSTLGRVLARGVETQALVEQLIPWIDQLNANINAGNLAASNNAKWAPSTWPATASGFGLTEAPRGALGHWVSVGAGKITQYQCVVPTTWNASPRDAAGQRGPYEQALLNTPVYDQERPLEILRTIHSFDPCMACAVHVVDADRNPLVEVVPELAHV